MSTSPGFLDSKDTIRDARRAVKEQACYRMDGQELVKLANLVEMYFTAVDERACDRHRSTWGESETRVTSLEIQLRALCKGNR